MTTSSFEEWQTDHFAAPSEDGERFRAVLRGHADRRLSALTSRNPALEPNLRNGSDGTRTRDLCRDRAAL
jgi:hypothetical protein